VAGPEAANNAAFRERAIGVLGFGMRRYDFPIAPVILGVILGPPLELQLRRTPIVSDGDWTALVDRPFAAAVLVVAVLALVIALLPGLIARLRGERFEGKRIAFGEED